MSRIAATFEALKRKGQKALIPFITAGDPDPKLTVPLMHALAYAAKLAPTLPQEAIMLVNLSGRGDKDMHTVAERMGMKF